MVYLFSSNCFPLYQKIDKCQAISFNLRIKESNVTYYVSIKHMCFADENIFKKTLDSIRNFE